MKKIAGFLSAAVAVLSLNGCGGSDSYDHTYYLQTYDDILGEYVGVEGVYYECDSYVGDTGDHGEFRMRDGDTCTFWDLDDTVSSEYNILYLGANSSGTVGLADVEYSCDSGISGETDYDGAFDFDPTYENPYYPGDVCDFYFFE
ncbi:hypothetical protein [Sulfurovum mangrovi]|uniref:hypothetical protein n=1 Tax=Sulfurovum mangrovi TaxID=2893889 RepID=UPI001E46A049|nr:hypothetical protein [Sulfurovum mangrovi]UFH59545.1 hypothetical protein LN246_01535 [Sulfurovum mangrovi]UFH60688.1 hypothetical protein LN246_14080 [Sulfurovum mangrovi]